MDKKFISLALNLAKKNLGLTAPNPVVGCVIVKDGEIIATGVTAAGGRPHAETIAINKVADKKILAGATLFVTLEPCSHQGLTPACVDQIIAHKFARVVVAAIDPDSRVNGGGIAKLRAANIDVTCGVLEKESVEINRGFFKVRTLGLPFVTLKLATSLDGKIATKNFASKWITSEKARQFAHYLRAENDAILIGANTLRHDNPLLDCRLAGLSQHSPARIIIANEINFSCELQIFQTAKKIRTIILTSASKASQHEENIAKLKNLGVEIIFGAEKNGRIFLPSALQTICQSGFNSILIEGGKNLATQFLQENLVDELAWIQNKKIIGNDGIAAIGDFNLNSPDEALQGFKRIEVREINQEDFVSFYRKNS